MAWPFSTRIGSSSIRRMWPPPTVLSEVQPRLGQVIDDQLEVLGKEYTLADFIRAGRNEQQGGVAIKKDGRRLAAAQGCLGYATPIALCRRLRYS